VCERVCVRAGHPFFSTRPYLQVCTRNQGGCVCAREGRGGGGSTSSNRSRAIRATPAKMQNSHKSKGKGNFLRTQEIRKIGFEAFEKLTGAVIEWLHHSHC